MSQHRVMVLFHVSHSFFELNFDIPFLCQHTLQKIDGYFNPYVRLSQLHLSIPGTIECVECVGYLLSNETTEQGSYKLIEHDIALMDHDYGTGCVGEVS